MTVTQMTYSLGRTLNTGNYESVKLDISMTADLEPEEQKGEAFRKLRDKVHLLMQDEVRDVLSKKTRTWSEDDE